MIEIKVEASLFPPARQLFVGGSNPRIFKGEFTIKVPIIPEFPDYWENVSNVVVGGIPLIRTGKVKEKKTIFGKAYLTGTSRALFLQLESQGWILEVDASNARGYPTED